MGLPYPFQESCDFGIGTSSGGLIILVLFAKYWDTKKSLTFFQNFAKRIFPPITGGCCLRRLQKLFWSYFTDGKYNAECLEDSLQEAFGCSPLFDTVELRPSGLEIAITATTISDATLCLFTNYNGHGSKQEGFRCKHIRATELANEVLLWEAARCTTAAPWFFKPKRLGPYGTFQDGGLKYINPLRPGIRAVKDAWKDGECDVVLSLGTGFHNQPTTSTAPNFRNVIQDGALARLYRASMSSLSLSGETSWRDHWHGLQEEAKAHHFRLDLPLSTREPTLDEVEKIPEMQNMVRHNLGDLREIARAFKAAFFFFELDQPLPRGTSIICHGSILCRSPNSRALVANLTAEYPSVHFMTGNGIALGELSQQDICNICGRYQKSVTLSIRHPSELVEIKLKFSRLFRRKIAGFPHTMQWFEDRQIADAKFSWPVQRQADLGKSACECAQRRVPVVIDTLAFRKRPLSVGSPRRSKRRCI